MPSVRLTGLLPAFAVMRPLAAGVGADHAGKVDVFSTYAPDGLVGPHHEKEGS